jgi:hypothetical protein
MPLSKFLSLPALLITVAILLNACGKDDSTPAALTGTLRGTVQVWNDKATSISDRSGVTVTLDNLSGKTTTTGADGSFQFTDLPFDSYDLSFSKSGYGTLKLIGAKLSGTTAGTVVNLPTVQFGALSTTTITALTLNNTTYNGGPGVSYNYTVSPAPTTTSRGYVRAFLSTSNAVTNTNYTAFSSLNSALSANVLGGFTASELYAMGFATGQTLFIKLYGDSYQSNDYEDPLTGKTIFPNLNQTSAPAISFIVP